MESSMKELRISILGEMHSQLRQGGNTFTLDPVNTGHRDDMVECLEAILGFEFLLHMESFEVYYHRLRGVFCNVMCI